MGDIYKKPFLEPIEGSKFRISDIHINIRGIHRIIHVSRNI